MTPARRSTAGWYYRRLRTMSAAELAWRASRSVRLPHPVGVDSSKLMACDSERSWEKSLERFRAGVGRPVLLNSAGAAAIAQAHPILTSELISKADASAVPSFQYFGYPLVELDQPIDWNFDPFANVRWPLLPSTQINHRTATGDVKWIWELNRLQHLPWLAQAWLFTGDPKYSKAAFEQLDSWIDQNPPGRGIAWRGAFEAGIRAISIAIAMQGLCTSPDLSLRRYKRVVDLLANSAVLCWNGRSRFSSANNHLVGEMAGLATVALIFPELDARTPWLDRAVRVLSREATSQILIDGAGAEQAIGYQMFTAELLHLVAVLLQSRDGYAPRPIVDALSRSSCFLATLTANADPAPRYGDDDEGFALRLGTSPVRTVGDHLCIVQSSLCDKANLSASLDAQWFRHFRNADEPTIYSPGSIAASTSNYYAEAGGLVILRSRTRRITMDVGPLGHLSIAAHGHADALAVTYSADGEEVLGDPGTGSYYGNPAWREMMRSTRAHPTVCIDGMDQSVSGGPFLWTRHAATTVRRVDLAAGVVDAEHDGYTRDGQNVIHRRWLIAPHYEAAVLVVDLVTGKGNHEIRSVWPVHPDFDMTSEGSTRVLIKHGQSKLLINQAATATLAMDDVRGDERTHVGWWSHRLESRVPSWWLSSVCNATAPLAIATLLQSPDAEEATNLRIDFVAKFLQISWSEGEVSRGFDIDTCASGAVSHYLHPNEAV